VQADTYWFLLCAAFAVISAAGFVIRHYLQRGKLTTLAIWGIRLTEGIDEEVKAVRAGLQPTIARVMADGIVTQLEREEVLVEIVRLVKVRFGVKALELAKRASGAIGLPLDTWLAQKVAPIAASAGLLPPLAVLPVRPEVGQFIAGAQDIAKRP
jgi:hypothetical protein